MIEYLCERCDRTILVGCLESAIQFGWQFRQFAHTTEVKAYCPTHSAGAKP